MGMPYPGGVMLDKLASEGNPTAYLLPRPHVEGSRYDFSFSGLKTAVINRLHNAEQKGEEINKADLCASFQATVTGMLTDNTLLAAEDLGATTIVLAGGVSANSGLRAQMEHTCKQRGYELYVPPLSLCGDNGAMVAAQGYYELLAGNTAGQDLNAVASLPIDQ